jgi:hypothetical protein
MDLQKLFLFGTESARFMFEKQGFLLPMWVGISDKGAHIPLMVKDMEDKDQIADGVRQFLKEKKITRYVSMLECWTLKAKGEAGIPPEVLSGGSLEKHPDRREAIHVLAEDKSGDTISGMFYILRPEHGKPKLSPLKVYPKEGAAEGRFAKMFD